jgi:hypothetical protein
VFLGGIKMTVKLNSGFKESLIDGVPEMLHLDRLLFDPEENKYYALFSSNSENRLYVGPGDDLVEANSIKVVKNEKLSVDFSLDERIGSLSINLKYNGNTATVSYGLGYLNVLRRVV